MIWLALCLLSIIISVITVLILYLLCVRLDRWSFNLCELLGNFIFCCLPLINIGYVCFVVCEVTSYLLSTSNTIEDTNKFLTEKLRKKD